MGRDEMYKKKFRNRVVNIRVKSIGFAVDKLNVDNLYDVKAFRSLREMWVIGSGETNLIKSRNTCFWF